MPRRRDRPVHRGARGRHVVVRRRVVEQVDDAVERGLVADGQLDGGDAGAERAADLGQRAVEVGPLTVQLVDDDDPGHAEAGRGAPRVLGLGLHAVGRAHDHDGEVDVGERGDHLAGEVGVAGRVQEVDLHAVDREGGQAGRDGELAGHFLRLEVHDGRTLLDRSPPGDGPGGRQQGLGQGGLARTVMPDEGDVANCGRVVWHLVLRPSVTLCAAECTTARSRLLTCAAAESPPPGSAGALTCGVLSTRRRARRRSRAGWRSGGRGRGCRRGAARRP